ncbi:hypothetical protein TNCV_2552211 [Trichonephila clavipes]|nr:hypothetical protein TNCV_2552211 [Trichonephila clavipes]
MPVVSLCFEHHASESTTFLGSTPILRENTLESVRGLPSIFPFHQPHERTWVRWLIRITPFPKGTTHLQTCMPSPGFGPSLNGTAVSLTKHYTG